jgi:hypothetical protein
MPGHHAKSRLKTYDSVKELANPGDDHVRVFDLPGDPNLHSVNKEREALGLQASASAREIARPDGLLSAAHV